MPYSNYSQKNNIHKQYFKDTGLYRIVPSKNYFWAERLRATQARTQILDLLKMTYKPLSLKQIHEILSDIHIATIYRTLNSLIEMDLVWKIYPNTRKRALFEIKPISRK